ncbi:MAG TPA: hypothetical protein VLA56_22075 [Pseudomonadales bacterium]|nr:hypothetical protein [Pseudomonadales bacterium]
MSEDGPDDLHARMRRLDPDGRRELLDDLESIRALLNARQGTGDLGNIPVLREVVRPAATGPETSEVRAADAAPRAEDPADATGSAGRSETQGDLFDPRAFADRLLNDEWRAQRDAILEDARAGARALPGSARPGSERFDAELHARLLASLGARVEELMDDALHDLRTVLHRTLREELEHLFADCFEARPGPPPNTDETD